MQLFFQVLKRLVIGQIIYNLIMKNKRNTLGSTRFLNKCFGLCILNTELKSSN